MLLSEYVNDCKDEYLVNHINKCITCQDEFEFLDITENNDWFIINVKGLKAKDSAKLCIKKNEVY